jgi:N-acylneuraminate cytidylyltransferase
LNIAIIPARSGSKRIPRKNIKNFCGKPVIAYSIEAALASGLFSEVMVSTDDQEIAEISKAYGANVPFLRSKKNSDDYTGTGDVSFEVLTEYKKQGKEFNYACCIYATAPLITPYRLKQGHELLINNKNIDTVFPSGLFSNSIWRSFNCGEDSLINMNFPAYEASRSQDLPESYFDAGQFYWFKTKNLEKLKNKNLFGIKKGTIHLDELEVQDIDNLKDWEIAEFKYEYRHRVTYV